MAEEPTCFDSNGSSSSFICAIRRTSFVNFIALCAMPESTDSVKKSTLRVYVWPLTA